MPGRRYSERFRQQALEKVYARDSRTIRAVADDLNMSFHTLRGWMNSDRKTLQVNPGSKRPKDWSLAERLDVLLESHGLGAEALNAFCREKGVFRHHLEQWQAAFAAGGSGAERTELRELKESNKALQSELNRKDKALAEAAALLVLQKKYQALWEEKDA